MAYFEPRKGLKAGARRTVRSARRKQRGWVPSFTDFLEAEKNIGCSWTAAERCAAPEGEAAARADGWGCAQVRAGRGDVEGVGVQQSSDSAVKRWFRYSDSSLVIRRNVIDRDTSTDSSLSCKLLLIVEILSKKSKMSWSIAFVTLKLQPRFHG